VDGLFLSAQADIPAESPAKATSVALAEQLLTWIKFLDILDN